MASGPLRHPGYDCRLGNQVAKRRATWPSALTPSQAPDPQIGPASQAKTRRSREPGKSIVFQQLKLACNE